MIVTPTQVVSFIDREFPASRESAIPTGAQNIPLSDPICGQLMGVVELVASIPEHLMPTDPDRFSGITLSVATIKTAVARFSQLDHRSLAAMGGTFVLLGINSRGSWNPVTLIRRSLEGLPDAVPSPTTSDFPFISDLTLRESLRLDLTEVQEAIRNRNYKSATVLAGSLIEALLLWAIEQKPAPVVATAFAALQTAKKISARVGSDPKQWYITEYLEVGLKLGLIANSTEQQCRLAKDFRNLIHPGRALRLGQKCNLATALSAAAAVEHVVTDLS